MGVATSSDTCGDCTGTEGVHGVMGSLNLPVCCSDRRPDVSSTMEASPADMMHINRPKANQREVQFAYSTNEGRHGQSIQGPPPPEAYNQAPTPNAYPPKAGWQSSFMKNVVSQEPSPRANGALGNGFFGNGVFASPPQQGNSPHSSDMGDMRHVMGIPGSRIGGNSPMGGARPRIGGNSPMSTTPSSEGSGRAEGIARFRTSGTWGDNQHKHKQERQKQLEQQYREQKTSRTSSSEHAGKEDAIQNISDRLRGVKKRDMSDSERLQVELLQRLSSLEDPQGIAPKGHLTTSPKHHLNHPGHGGSKTNIFNSNVSQNNSFHSRPSSQNNSFHGGHSRGPETSHHGRGSHHHRTHSRSPDTSRHGHSSGRRRSISRSPTRSPR